MKISFLHTHPEIEETLGISKDYVIVDKKELDRVMTFLIQNPRVFQFLVGKEEFEKQWGEPLTEPTIVMIKEKCSNCKGEGYTNFYDQGEPDLDSKCPACNGTGIVYNKPTAEGAIAKTDEWKLVSHSHQIADTGDYDGCYEITNGKVSIYTQDDDDEALQPIVDTFNNSGCKFYLDDADAFENHILRDEIAELKERLAFWPQPTAEGAEEILTNLETYYDFKFHWIERDRMIRAMHEFATLHAQKIADKMVSERLREELMRYDQWLLANDMGDMFDDTVKCVDEYLKSKEK